MKTRVTLRLDSELLGEAKIVAAEQGRSLSALLVEHLEALVRDRKDYDRARLRALARLRDGLSLGWAP
jgi:predicted DNA-binding protein